MGEVCTPLLHLAEGSGAGKYRFQGVEKANGIGPYPALSLADARERRDSARKRLANGIDPMAERMAEKTAVREATEHTFEKVAELWLELCMGKERASCRNGPGIA